MDSRLGEGFEKSRYCVGGFIFAIQEMTIHGNASSFHSTFRALSVFLLGVEKEVGESRMM